MQAEVIFNANTIQPSLPASNPCGFTAVELMAVEELLLGCEQTIALNTQTMQQTHAEMVVSHNEFDGSDAVTMKYNCTMLDYDGFGFFGVMVNSSLTFMDDTQYTSKDKATRVWLYVSTSHDAMDFVDRVLTIVRNEEGEICGFKRD